MATLLYAAPAAHRSATLVRALERAGHQLQLAEDITDLRTEVYRQGVEAVLLDPATPGDDPVALVRDLRLHGVGVAWVRSAHSEGGVLVSLPVLELPADLYTAREAVAAALADTSPLPTMDIPSPVAAPSTAAPDRSSSPFERLVGRSEGMRLVKETVEQVAPHRVTVLLQGESGTGKEVLARVIHDLSGRDPFVAVNCAALAETLVESELFGHEKGAFTGAATRHTGAFERAHGGTLLLDEISEIDSRLQAKLLRAIQEGEIVRVGGSEPVAVDVRIIATTNRDLADAVEEGRFREDLYYRLCVIPLAVPPLRQRREDIPALAEHFAAQAAAEMGKPVRGIAPRALEMLLGHSWPGNIRELKHAIERATALSSGEWLQPDDFIPAKRGLVAWRVPRAASQAHDVSSPVVARLESYNLEEARRILLEAALEASGGSRSQAAELLGVTTRTLRNWLNG